MVRKKIVIIAGTPQELEGKDLSTKESVEKAFSKKENVWDKVMAKGRTQEKGIAHQLTDDEVITIVETARALGCNNTFVAQLNWDLTQAKYKIFDEIGMLLTGRNKGYGETPEELNEQIRFTNILAHLYLMGSIKELIEDLRIEDYATQSAYNRLMERSKKKLGDVI
jgi:hypothetical protein